MTRTRSPVPLTPLWVSPDRYLSVSFLSSFLFHAVLAGLWLWIHARQKASEIRLTSVDLIEILPQEAQASPVEPAQRAPKNILEFLKMALPQIQKEEIREVETPEMRRQRLREAAPAIDLSRRTEIKTAPALNLSRPPAPETAASLAEAIAPEKGEAKPGLPVEIAQAPAIDIEEIGRRRVAPPAVAEVGAIRLEGSRTPAPAIREIQTPIAVPRKTEKTEAAALAPVSISARPRAGGRATAGPTVTEEQLPVGFGRGRLTGVRPRPAPSLAEVTAKPAEKKTEAAAVLPAPPKKQAVEIAGPISGRKILKSFLPVYPEWAKRRGVEADVSLRFFVSPDGTVRDKITIEVTSGHLELDKLSMEAIRRWVFAPLEGAGDQWGVVTFRFRLE